MENEIKKSYNPFKMWGSWIGFFIGIILLTFPAFFVIKQSGFLDAVRSIIKISPIYYWESSWCDQPGCGFITFFSTRIIFFLYGWGIHSLIRKYTK